MYISKVLMPWPLAKNPYNLHRGLWEFFPDRHSESRSFLFRVESIHRGHHATILMQSSHKPTPIRNEHGPSLIAVKPISFTFTSGQRLRFRVRANPIKSIKDANRGTYTKNGQKYTKSVRVPLVREDEQQAWLERKLQPCSHIDALLIQSEPPLNFRKIKEQRSGKIQPVLFDGILSITNPEGLNELIVNGIGPAKSFGCGMLSLAQM